MNVRIPASIFRAVIGLLGCLALACVGAAVHAQATYVVQPGDTLSSIAARHNISYITLAELNGLAKPYVLQVGQTLTFASPPPQLLAPEYGKDFVESDLELAWQWEGDLRQNQLFALRLWAEGRDALEVWTSQSSVNAQREIDSYSVDYGKFYWQVAVVNLDTAGGFASMGSAWSEARSLQRLRRLSLAALPYVEMSAAAQSFADQELSASELIDAVHLFIHENSQTNEQPAYAADYADAIDMMFAHAQGENSDMPQLLCDGRSTAMLTLLREFGIESRLVFLYADTPGYISQHTMLEVFNPDTQRWQVHDVGFDFYFVDGAREGRVNAAPLLFGKHDTVLGCPIAGGVCSRSVAGQSLSYFEALRYGHTFEVWANPDRFDISDRFAGQANMNLAEFIGDGDSTRVTLRLESWLEFPN
ncbi:MAG: LysM peptidoglycan-binding domain-containing protein [Chloroflexi bacterium]|nr:LysM peptidoglycan-binding domain-containing protein [Chloroflexota bacterium]MCY3581757.1 LysM peptidoglycan-binding domain-containing protein [Chloroflexota bacterium]MXX51041.1 LysM peptidoglycan-binding domain-containing protein [Chloroflexota bacterium]MXX81915.1 LysM peptidoglycan-binding domain-containing protein [Chloroflexota bacterium]MYA94226.1 LysM peptidoglycan-binding domain-containing protein [Chloroflexota bacterium]